MVDHYAWKDSDLVRSVYLSATQCGDAGPADRLLGRPERNMTQDILYEWNFTNSIPRVDPNCAIDTSSYALAALTTYVACHGSQRHLDHLVLFLIIVALLEPFWEVR